MKMWSSRPRGRTVVPLKASPANLVGLAKPVACRSQANIACLPPGWLERFLHGKPMTWALSPRGRHFKVRMERDSGVERRDMESAAGPVGMGQELGMNLPMRLDCLFPWEAIVARG